ncbi:hypothetical protein CPB86DRAFT_820936 [Serendipita vermifera]|nr:hypothetical protein CPB86DRAFT_821073 [Serendipita vermifera]PVF90929.1 hypothetical protein CPB86DRAFT_820936 [Serendipita vermifera]
MTSYNAHYDNLVTYTHNAQDYWNVESMSQAYPNENIADINTFYYPHAQMNTYSGPLSSTARPFLPPFPPYPLHALSDLQPTPVDHPFFGSSNPQNLPALWDVPVNHLPVNPVPGQPTLPPIASASTSAPIMTSTTPATNV